MNSSPRYLIGIDLGTTHTVVACADLQNGAENAEPSLFEIEQLIAPGEVARRPLLPSFRYHPAPGELPEEQLVLPWQSQPLPGDDVLHVTGELARELGSKVEGRQIASAKSWLSHDKVDRSAPILPWAAAEGVAKASPVVASASYLNHVRCAWNHDHPEHPLEQQAVVITVPASFDEAARSLTLQAAELAGYPAVTLLEEPQAVCYDWFHRHRDTAVQQLQQSRLLFVVDVGGGTTDLSLIRVQTSNGQLQLDRIAVGDHLMLGGDNVDLALAHQAEQRISGEGKKLSAASLSQLIQQSRKAKELLLGERAPESAKVTLLGSGARLIGGARSAEFSRDEVQALALDGFFPLIGFGEQPARRSSAVVEFGLPYAPDPAVSRYLSQFLSTHQNSCREALGLQVQETAIPDTVLFNGGVFKSSALKHRALEVLGQWRGQPVTELHNQHPDLAVAFGAVAFALAQRTSTLKIGGGSPRSYFLQVQTKSGDSKGVCLLPKGTEEGAEIALHEHRFALRLNQPVQFHLAACSADDAFNPGSLVDLNNDRFLPLPPLVAALDDGDAQQEIPVTLVTRLTQVGTLDIHCQSEADPSRRWKVEFQLRRDLQARHQKSALPPKFNDAITAIDEVFGPGDKQADPNAVKRLRQTIEKLLGERDQWDTALARALFDALWERSKRRRRSAQHERVWFNLAGYCLRPGFGYPADDWRISQIWALYAQGLQFNQENQSWAEWWTFWRRAAGGLDQTAQQRILKDIAKFLNPATARNLKIQQEIKNKSYEDMVRLAAALENLDLPTKTELGDWLLKRLEKSSETATSWWALGRIGAREPFHGSAHNVVSPAQSEKWLNVVRKQDWRKNQNAAFSAVMLARVSGDRSRDLEPALRHDIAAQLRAVKAPDLWVRMVTEHVALDETESRRVFGETLPSGLKLMQ